MLRMQITLANFASKTTKGGKIDNRSRLFTDSFASHLLTYGGEYYRQEQQLEEQQLASGGKDRFQLRWLQDEITLRDLPYYAARRYPL